MPPEDSFFAHRPALRPLAYRDFRLLLAGTTLIGIILPLQFLTQVFWIQDYYPGRSVFYTTLIAGSRGLAMLIFALLGGAIADRMERRHVLLYCAFAALALNAAVAFFMVDTTFGSSTIFAVTAVTFFSAGVLSIDQPARQAAIPSVVGMASLSSAISLNMIALQLTLPLSLPLIGFLNGVFDPGHVYAGSLAGLALAVPLIAMLRFSSQGQAAQGTSMLANIAEGLRYSARSPVIFGVIAIVVVIQVIGMPGVANPLGPVWMTEVLGLSPAQFGFMAMTWGIGAMVTSIGLARLQGLVQRGPTLCFAAVLFGVSILVFGYSRSVPLTAFANFTLGIALTAMLVTSSTIVQQTVSDEMRGRVMGLFPLTLGLAQLNTMTIGAAAQLLGLTLVVPALGWITLALSGAIILGQPALRRAKPEPRALAPPGRPVPEQVAGAD